MDTKTKASCIRTVVFFVSFVSFVSFASVVAGAAQQRPADAAQTAFDRAAADFRAGRMADAVAGFDALIKLEPDAAPQLWQRGIALYYLGRYKDCRAQFELHRTVNPDDVENAAWHFLCVAKAEGAQKARAALLPVGPDSRVPMGQVYSMLRGATSPDEVIKAAGSQPGAQFYAQLYVGLYYDALGDKSRALEHIRIAAGDRFAQAGGNMYSVARSHLGTLEERR